MLDQAVSYTLREAASVTGMSRVTMRRYLDQGRFPHAFRDEGSGDVPAPWRVPLGDLLAAGLSVVSDGPRSVKRPDAGPVSHSGEVGAAHVMQQQLAVASALATERDRTIEILAGELADLRRLLTEALATLRSFSTAQHQGAP